MSHLSRQSRADLVAALSLNAGQAETSDPRVVFPVPEHVRALEPEVVLVVGDRGAGKTQLARAFVDDAVRGALARWSAGVRVPQGSADWRTGWPLGRAGPDAPAWRDFASALGRDRESFIAVWLAYLARLLQDRFDEPTRTVLRPLLDVPGVDVESCLGAYRTCRLAVTTALDALDERLAREDRWIFVAYDELDTIVLDDWDALGVIVRGLVSLWAAYARRWQRLRPKVFLRSDFYRHHREVAGADVAKLVANRVELQWSDRNLYGALIKHIINKRVENGADSLYEHFSRVVPIDTDPVIGRIPKLTDAVEARPFIDRLVGEHMGESKKKGLAFTWMLDHLRDGNGRIVPRTLVWLIEYAAEIERDKPRAVGSHLLHPVSLRRALDRVSVQYVEQAQTHEFRWFTGLRARLQRDREVPWNRRELLALVRKDFEHNWGARGELVRPPGQTPDEVVERLIELGILRQRRDDLLDVPDIYLDGLGLMRRGGVAKR